MMKRRSPEHGQVLQGLSDPGVRSAQTVLVHSQSAFVQRQRLAVFLLPTTDIRQSDSQSEADIQL